MNINKIIRYFKNAPYRRESLAYAFLKIPRRFYGWFIPERLQEKNTIYGFRRFDLPLLMSYSRSGTNWLRYFIEVVSNQPTPGHERYISGRTDYIIDRAHAGFRVSHKHPRLILVLRDYRECLIRQHGMAQIQSYPSIEDFLEEEYLFQPASWYIKNIQSYDAFEGPKLLLYYEDILAFPERELKRLAKFLRLNKEATAHFFETLEEHQNTSVQFYNKNQQSHTQGNRSKMSHHAQKLSPAEREAFDQFYKKKYPVIYYYYLKQYRASID